MLPTVALYYTRARTGSQNLTRATRGRSQCKHPQPRTQYASDTQPAAPPIWCPDAPLTRFRTASAPACHQRSHSASKRHTANRERRAATFARDRARGAGQSVTSNDKAARTTRITATATNGIARAHDANKKCPAGGNTPPTGHSHQRTVVSRSLGDERAPYGRSYHRNSAGFTITGVVAFCTTRANSSQVRCSPSLVTHTSGSPILKNRLAPISTNVPATSLRVSKVAWSPPALCAVKSVVGFSS